jgi:Subtilisin inhibitor-like
MKPTMHKARRSAWLLLVTALCAVLAACGSAAAGGSTSNAAPAAKPAKVSLHITVSGANTKPRQWTLRCDPPGGTHPNPAAACRVLLAPKNAPSGSIWVKPKMAFCPMILASAKRATVSGIWFGKHIHITMIDGGCWLARWSRIGQIFN